MLSFVNRLRDATRDFDVARFKNTFEDVLGELGDRLPDLQTRLRNRIKESAQEASERLASLSQTVGDLTPDLDMAPLKDVFAQSRDQIEATLEASLPYVRLWLQQSLGFLSRELLHNDVLMRQALLVAYQLLPTVIRVVIHEDRFVTFCLEHRDRFLEPSTKDAELLLAD